MIDNGFYFAVLTETNTDIIIHAIKYYMKLYILTYNDLEHKQLRSGLL